MKKFTRRLTNFFIFIAGILSVCAVVFVGIMFILQQNIPLGVGVTDKEFIQSLVNITLGAMIILFAGDIYNSVGESIRRRKE